MKILSPAFEHQQKIPSKYTCNGENVNPPLQFQDIPKEAKSLVLIVDDPDAVHGVWVHWVVYAIDPKTTDILENSKPTGVQGVSSFGKPGYGGPCPPSGTHRYFFKLYALDMMLEFDASEEVDKGLLEKKMQDHILAQAELIGLYSQS